MGSYKQDTLPVSFQKKNEIHNRLINKAISLGISKEDAPSVVYHLDKLANIIINSYINTKGEKICKMS